MMRVMSRSCVLSLCLCACVVDTDQTSSIEQPGIQMQGIQMQGIQMQGIQMQGMSLVGFQVDGATWNGAPLSNVHVQAGGVVANIGAYTLSGTALTGARFYAQARNLNVDPPATAIAQYRITAVAPESFVYDPTYTGATYLYTLEQWVADTSSWQSACAPDADGRRVAIPLAATWDERGNRVESSSLFTFGCTTGVIAKCYRWGYRPWVTGYGDLVTTHQICTRMARADYCGNGVPHTRDGTQVNVWDTLPPPGPIQRHGWLTPLGMVFEAGWDTGGAVCLSRERWLLGDGLAIAAMCPDRLVPPGLGETVCDTVGEVLGYDADVKLFNESYLNLGL